MLNCQEHKFLVHRLIADTWIDNPQNLPIINHKDNNPRNNNVENPEWCDYSYNINYAIKQGRSNYYSEKRIKSTHSKKRYLYKSVDKYDKDGVFIQTYESITSAANGLIEDGKTLSFQCAKSNISACCYEKSKTAYGYIWKFTNV